MGKAARIKRMRRLKNIEMEASFSERLTKNFQKELRSSELWDQMVAELEKKKPSSC